MRLFVYGTLKRGYGLHRVIQDCRFLGTANTVKPHALLDAGYPVMTPLETGANVVRGEVYEVTSATLIKRLDDIESAYDRKKIMVQFDDGATMRVHAYIGKPSWWTRLSLATYWLRGNAFEFKRADFREEEEEENV
jgi:gamma-glutamylaminecyclotransferase